MTKPKKNESEISTPRLRRLPSGAPSTCAPTKPTTPTPVGIVQGQVLVESMPPIAATSSAKSGY
jgi:hypothetical protein